MVRSCIVQTRNQFYKETENSKFISSYYLKNFICWLQIRRNFKEKLIHQVPRLLVHTNCIYINRYCNSKGITSCLPEFTNHMKCMLQFIVQKLSFAVLI